MSFLSTLNDAYQAATVSFGPPQDGVYQCFIRAARVLEPDYAEVKPGQLELEFETVGEGLTFKNWIQLQDRDFLPHEVGMKQVKRLGVMLHPDWADVPIDQALDHNNEGNLLESLIDKVFQVTIKRKMGHTQDGSEKEFCNIFIDKLIEV